MSHKVEVEEYGSEEQCSVAECRASTSRGLSHSSGDCEYCDQDQYSTCSEECCSRRCAASCQKPCAIADSATKLPKSKWRTIKTFFKNHMNPIRANRKRDPQAKPKELNNEVIIRDSKPASDDFALK